MSEQNTEFKAQKREDMLMDMYKIHAYIPNDAEGNPLTPFGNFCAGYEAATTEANKRIAELESEVKESIAQKIRYYLKHQNYPIYDDADDYEKGVIVTCENLEKIIIDDLKR